MYVRSWARRQTARGSAKEIPWSTKLNSARWYRHDATSMTSFRARSDIVRSLCGFHHAWGHKRSFRKTKVFLTRRAKITTTTPSLSLSLWWMCVCIYACMYVFVCVHVGMCIYICTYTCMCELRNPEPYVCACNHARIHECMYLAWRAHRKKRVPSTNIILSAVVLGYYYRMTTELLRKYFPPTV